MVVAMGEDETFAPSCTRGQRVTTQSRGDTIERTVAFLQPLSVELVGARPPKGLRRAQEAFVGAVSAHIWRRPQRPEVPLQFLDGVGVQRTLQWPDRRKLRT
jgi:hypothetical protein